MSRIHRFLGGACLFVVPGVLHAAAPQGRLYVGTDAGVFNQVKRFDYPGRLETASFAPYAPTFTGGVRVAAGDVNGDGTADIITGAGPGGGPHVKVFNGTNNAEIGSLFPFTPSFTGGVYVAAGDVNGDGVPDTVVGAGATPAGGGGAGGPRVVVFDGVTQAPLHDFLAYDPTFTGGVRVAVGDVNGDGRADVITGAGPGGGPHVKVFNGATGALERSVFAFEPNFLGGVYVAAGDIDGDGRADLVAGMDEATGAPSGVNLFSGVDGSSLGTLTPFGTGFSGGVRVAAGDLNGDGRADIVVGSGPGGGGHVRVFSGGGGLAPIDSFFAFGPSYTGGVFVAAIPEPTGVAAMVLTALLLSRRRARRACGA